MMERREQRAKALADQEAQPTLFTDLKMNCRAGASPAETNWLRSGCSTTDREKAYADVGYFSRLPPQRENSVIS